MSLELLLLAAEYVDRTETDHGYACRRRFGSVGDKLESGRRSSDFDGPPTTRWRTASSSSAYRQKQHADDDDGFVDVARRRHHVVHGRRRHRTASLGKKPSDGCRNVHNELEKNRRAELRSHIDRLKDIVPLGSGASRHTTQGLLTKACHLIKTLELSLSNAMETRDQLANAQRDLRRRYCRLASTPLPPEQPTTARWTSARCNSTSSESSSIGDCSSLSSEFSQDSEMIDVVECSTTSDDVDSGCDTEIQLSVAVTSS